MPLAVRFEPILPKDLDFPSKQFERFKKTAVSVMNSNTKPGVKRELSKFTRGWRTRVDFSSAVARRPDRIFITIFPRGQPGRRVWEWVSEGTRENYPISPGELGYLAIADYQPFTRPGGVFGGPGSRSDDVGFVTRTVPHPGIEAREFEKHAADSYEDEFGREMTLALRLSNK
jgi:hypothetical protein